MGNEKHGWWVQDGQEEVGSGAGNGEAEELVCVPEGHELGWRRAGGRVVWGRGE